MNWHANREADRLVKETGNYTYAHAGMSNEEDDEERMREIGESQRELKWREKWRLG